MVGSIKRLRKDYCDTEGAIRLKEMIESYWAERGASVTVGFVNQGFVPIMQSTRVDVRSDMINGLPRKFNQGSRQ